MTKSIEVQKSEEVKNFFSCFQADLKYKVISVHFRILIYSVLIPNSKTPHISDFANWPLYFEIVDPELIFSLMDPGWEGSIWQCFLKRWTLARS